MSPIQSAPCLVAKMNVLIIILTLSAATIAQETHHCPDGWHVYVSINKSKG